MDDTNNGYLNFASNLSHIAHKTAMKYFSQVSAVYKSDNSPVTKADLEINEIVLQAVKDAYPDFGLLGEEISYSSDRETIWVCDPIDGTRSFLAGIPTFHFSLALVVQGRPIFALISDLTSGKNVWAAVGKGAYTETSQIHVNTLQLSESIVGVGSLGHITDNPTYYKSLSASVRSLEMIHGCVIKGSLVARGFLGASLSGKAKQWDFAAIDLIVSEAGGKLTYLDGSLPNYANYIDQEVIVSNGVVHQAIIDLVRSFNS